jgi:hypothetical protein
MLCQIAVNFQLHLLVRARPVEVPQELTSNPRLVGYS